MEKGDDENGMGQVRHPPWDGTLAASAARGAQQIKIAAAHKPQAGPHQSNGATTQVVRFPGRSGWNPILLEEDFRNLAICCTGETGIESTKCKYELPTLQLRKGIGRSTGALACQKPPEAQRRIRACSKIDVEWSHRRNRRINFETTHENERETPFGVAHDTMFTVARVTPENRRQRDKRART